MALPNKSLDPAHVARWLAVTRGYFCTDLDVLLRPTIVRRLKVDGQMKSRSFVLCNNDYVCPPGLPIP